MINRKQIPEFVSRKKPFQGSNIYGKFEFSRLGSYVHRGVDLYVVYSYGQHWPLLVSPLATKPYWEAQWIVNKDKYSCTTTRHLTVVTNWLYSVNQGTNGWTINADFQGIVELAKVEHIQRWIKDWESEYRKYEDWKASALADYMAG
jgi:hypothetical protein